MRPFLEELGFRPALPDWPTPSAEWRNRLFSKEPGSARLIAIIEAPLRDKPRMLLTALLPPDSADLSQELYADLSPKGRLRAYTGRWTPFLRASPRLARDLASYWKGRKASDEGPARVHKKHIERPTISPRFPA